MIPWGGGGNSWIGGGSVLEPSWPIPVFGYVLVAVVLLAGLLYSYHRQIRWIDGARFSKHWGQASVLAILRTLVCLLILWMLSAWMVQPFETEHPEILLLMDGSNSMSTIDAVEERATESRLAKVKTYLLNGFLGKLEERFHVRLFVMGDGLKEIASEDGSFEKGLEGLSSEQAHSRIGNGVRDAIGLSRGQSVAAIVLWTDGINTDGIELQEASLLAKERRVPLYVVGLGERQRHPDLRIRDVLADPVVFLGDSVSLQVLVERRDLENRNALVRLRDSASGETLQEQKVRFAEGENEATVQLEWKADRAGRKDLRIEVQPEESEQDQENNVVTRSMEVRDTAIPVLLVGGGPSYEFRFLKHLLERTRQTGDPQRAAFDVKSVLEQADADYVLQDATSLATLPAGVAALEKYDVVILGDASSAIITKPFLQSLQHFVSDYGGGLMVVAGPENMPQRFRDTELAQLLPIEIDRVRVSEIESAPFHWMPSREIPLVLPLKLDGASEANRKRWGQLPKQHWRHLNLFPKSVAQVLAYTSEGDSKGDPILVSAFVGAGRVAFQGTDETYLWQSYLGDDVYYQRYWTQMMRWLSRNRALHRQEANLELNASRYRAGGAIHATLQLDKAQETLPSLRVRRNSEWMPSIIMERQPDHPSTYEVTMNQVETGVYLFEWTSEDGTEVARQECLVEAIPGELAQLDPDITSMRDAAKLSQGKYVDWKDVPELEAALPKSGLIRLRPLPKLPIWNHWVFVVALIGLLSGEWLLRRRLGLV